MFNSTKAKRDSHGVWWCAVEVSMERVFGVTVCTVWLVRAASLYYHPHLTNTVAQTTVPMFACFSLKSITPNRI